MAEPHKLLDSAPDAEALLTRCCGAQRWVAAMLAERPFRSALALYEAAERHFSQLDEDDYLEAFSHHPRLGEDLALLRARFASTAQLAAQEQAGAQAASEATLLALREANQAYAQRFGFTFILCATGKSADQMLEALQQRLANTRAQELVTAIGEQAKITRLRLEKLTP
jgi:2-oxo-4-hydroxy-4-carboxy-5-ureidoimidazoline decarboxylase